MKQRYFDQLVVGFALFSMFFGAGNIIFPPYLGLTAGSDWFSGFFSYYMADIGLAVVSIFAIIKNGGDVTGITGRIGKVPGTIMMSAIILCIGPLIAIPRTGATTFEMLVAPVFKIESPVIPIILFFAVILLLTIRESAVIDILGKFLTPALFVGLIILIIKGIISPIGPIPDLPQTGGIISDGVNAGYQTMDVLAALAFGIIIVKTVADKGYTEEKLKYKIVRGSSLIAAAGLLLVYCGLTFLGATAASFYNTNINRSELIINITQLLMGQPGVIILGIVVALACITTAVALVSACADYFSDLTKSKLNYKMLTIVICIFSAVVANFGIDQIVAIAQPILSLIYPGALTLIIMSFFSGKLSNDNIYKGAVTGAILASLCEILNGWGVPLGFITHLPLADLGFAWLTPAVIFGILGGLIPHKQ